MYEHFVILNGDKEAGYFTRMSRTFENADFAFYQEETQNGSWLNGGCEKRRVWMSRTDYQDNGLVNSIQNSNFFLPLYTDLSFNGWCIDLGNGDDLNFVEDVSNVEILSFNNVNTFTISGPSFSLNPCEGHRYRYQMGQGIGLISCENLDLMDGKWELVEFEVQ